MLFNSFEFISFFLAIFILYWSLPHRFRWLLLLIASYFFYISWEPVYIFLILFSTGIDYFLCRYLTGSEVKKKRITGLLLSILMNLALLFTFKYHDFFQDILADVLTMIDVDYTPRRSGLLLPIGISFYTFQTLSYSIDVYRQKINVEKHLGKFALYVSFFPQLIAGPIERAQDLLVQFHKKSLFFKTQDFKDGLLLFIWGLFKKVVVADNVKILVDHVYDNPEFQNGGSVIFASVLFAIQLYADFSGYSDMAIGTAKMLGINLKTNFRTPYFAQSVTEFWGRWHITLSYWLRDYVFIPLGGSRNSSFKTFRNIFIVFLLSGIWHGAGWHFVIWGVIHALFVIIEKIFGLDSTGKNAFVAGLKILFTFSIVSVTMMCIRVENVEHLSILVHKIGSFQFYDFYIAVAENKLTPGIMGVMVLFFTDVFIAKRSILGLMTKHRFFQYSWSAIIILLILFVGENTGEAFFYFQF